MEGTSGQMKRRGIRVERMDNGFDIIFTNTKIKNQSVVKSLCAFAEVLSLVTCIHIRLLTTACSSS